MEKPPNALIRKGEGVFLMRQDLFEVEAGKYFPTALNYKIYLMITIRFKVICNVKRTAVYSWQFIVECSSHPILLCSF